MELRVLAVAAAVLLALSAPVPASGQAVVTSCTASLITSFSPCINFITNSTASPTADCCRSLAAVVNASTTCACLILTGSVPLGTPVNRTLAVTLPKACNSKSVGLQCKDSTVQSPAPGPVADSPAISALPPTTPESLAPPPAEPTALPPPAEATALPPATSQGQTRPQVVPNSARGAHASVMPAFVVLLAVGTMLI